MKKFILLFALLGACSPIVQGTHCEATNTSRCFQENVELCGPNGQWTLVMDCPQLGDNWTCKAIEDGDFACQKETE